jgi:hypothetical protein
LHGSISSLVHRRGPVFWFRKSIPVDLIDRLGPTDIRRSLRTCNGRVARQRAWALILVVEEAFAILRDAGLSPGARDAFNAVLSHVMDDLDRSGQQWSQRLRYRALLDSLGGVEPAAPPKQIVPASPTVGLPTLSLAGSSDLPQQTFFAPSTATHDTANIAQAVMEAIRP